MDDNSCIGFLYYRGRRILLVNGLRTIGLRVDERVGKSKVVFTQVLVIVTDIFAELLSTAREIFRTGAKAGHVDIHEIGAASHHAAGPVHPGFHHLTPAHQIGL